MTPLRHHLWLRVASAVLALFWGFFFYGVIDLLAFAQGPDFHDSLVLSTGWGLLFLLLVGTPLVALSVAPRPSSSLAPAEVLMVAVALLVAAALSGAARQVVAAGGLAVSVAVLVALGAQPVYRWPSTWRPSAGPLVVLAAAVVPGAHYAWTSARTTGSGVLTDVTFGLDHWPVKAALPLAALLIGVVAVGHPRGWRFPTWSVGAVAAWFAVVCWLEPDLVGSISRPWSAALLAWSVAFVAVTQLSSPEHARVNAERSAASAATHRRTGESWTTRR